MISCCGGEIVSTAVNAVLYRIHPARPEESENSTARLSKCKMLHSIQYSHWDSNTDHADSKPIETNGKTALDCYSILMTGCYILGQYASLRGRTCVRASVYVCACVWACICVCETLGKDELQRIFYTSLGSCLLFTGTRVQPLHLPVLKGMIHGFVLCCLWQTHSIPSTHSLVSNQPGTAVLFATQGHNRTPSRKTLYPLHIYILFQQNVKSCLSEHTLI